MSVFHVRRGAGRAPMVPLMTSQARMASIHSTLLAAGAIAGHVCCCY